MVDVDELEGNVNFLYMKGGNCLIICLYLLLTVCLLFTDLGTLLTMKEKDEVNSSILHSMLRLFLLIYIKFFYV